MKFLKALTILLIPLALCACATSQQILLDANTPTSICQTGDTIQIILPENPTTGYVWKIAKDGSPALKFENQIYQQNSTAKNICGAGGTVLFTFRAVDSGNAEVALTLGRPWEDNVSQSKIFKISVQ